MKLIIDADACPVMPESIKVARREDIPVTIVGNTTQDYSKYTKRRPGEKDGAFRVEAVNVAVGADSADFEIIRMLEEDDIVVTQDIGLAAMVLGRGAKAIGVRGRIYDPITIDSQLAMRHLTAKERRRGVYAKGIGPKAFTSEDRERFEANLTRLMRGASY